MAPKQRIRISKERLHRASKGARVSKRKRISKERLLRALKRARVSKRKGISKARKDLQKDPPTSSSAATKQQDSCSHASSSLGVCDVCEALLLEFCGMPLEYMLEGRISTEDVLWFWP